MSAAVYISIFLSIFIIGLIYVIIKRKKYEVEFNFLIIIVIYFISELIFFLSFNISTEKIYDTNLATFLWKISLFSKLFSIGLWTSIYSVELHKGSRFRFICVFFYTFIEGLVIALFFDANLFTINQVNKFYNYKFQNLPLIVSILIFNIFTLIWLLLSQMRGFKNFNDKNLGLFYYIFIFILSINMFFYTTYLFSLNFLFKNLHLVSYLVNFAYVFIIIITKPSLFLVFTNRLYNFIIFHKSGILLYSYNFQTDKEADDSLLKGSILIGINHILANFSNIENQLSLIKLSERGVVFNFNNDLGYAILLIAKHKNITLEKTVNKFMHKFSEINKANLTNLKGLIDVSVFKNTNEIITDVFKHYIVKKS